jgi:autotransporter-associated beta strand protein
MSGRVSMRRCGFAQVVGLASLATGLGFGGGAAAQSVNIPLQLEQGSGGTILVINVGIDGQSPRPYLFDTGSNLFNAFYSASAFGAVPESEKGRPIGEPYNYGDGKIGVTYTLNVVGTPSLAFYPTSSGASSGVTLNATTPAGAASTFLMGAVTSAKTCSTTGICTSIAPPLKAYGSFRGYYGIFGANTLVNTYPGGVFGQAVVPGATAGYVVAANGQALSASIPGATTNGPQVGQSVTSCSPCVMLGLTPALLAQFEKVNKLRGPAVASAFPNSGAPSFNPFGVDMKVSLTSPTGTTVSYPQPTLLDTGTPTNIIASAKVAATTPSASGSTLTISDGKRGSDTTRYSLVSGGNPPSPYVAETEPYTPPKGSTNTKGQTFLGVGFFLQNSVLFNLAGQTIGYTPNFVTDTSISTTSASPLVIGSNSVPLGLAGVISGAGGVSIANGGSATLSGANTYTGATTVSGGALALVGPGGIATSSGVNVSAGGVFDISRTTAGATIASLSGDSKGSVALGRKTLALSDASGSYGGAITGKGGLTLLAGAQTLTGTVAYRGATTIDGGVLTVNGVIARSASVTVNASGALAGDGVVDPATVSIAAGGALAPGAPGASLTIDGNLVFAPGAIYVVETSGAQTSTAAVNGTATLGGATVEWAPPQGLGKYSAQTFPILAAASLSGAFNTNVVPLTASAEKVVYQSGAPSLSYVGGDVTLSAPNYAVTLAAPANAPANAQNVAGAINGSILAGETLPSGFQNLTSQSGASLNVAINQLGGQVGAAFTPVGFLAGDQLLSMALDPFVDGRDGDFGPASRAWTAYAADDDPIAARAAAAIPPAKPLAPSQFTVWGGSYAGGGAIASNAATGAAGVNSQIFGFLAGIDDHVTAGATVGLALGGGAANWQLTQGMGSGQSGMAQEVVYGASRSGPVYVSGALGYSWADATTNRTVSLAGADKLNARFDANILSSRLEAGYRLPPFAALPVAFGVTPYAAVQAQGLFLPYYAESAAFGSSSAFALSYSGRDYSDVRTELGAWFDADLAVAPGAKFFSRVAWAHNVDNEGTINAVFQQLPGSLFSINAAKPSPNSALVTAGLGYRFGDGWSITAKFDGDFAVAASSYAGTAVLRKVW